jgi:glycosyltransferase involved in cell wall biosynthesis
VSEPAGSAGRGTSVTVVIPVWDDYVPFLPEAVESVQRDAPDVPIIVVDNASRAPVPEPSGTVVIRAAGRLTVGAARNLGLESVETEYVVALDADDMLLPGTLGFLKARLEDDPSIAVCTTSILEGETGERHRTPRWFVPFLSRRRRSFALANCLWSLFPIQGSAMLRTAQVREAGGYGDASWGEDWVLGVSLAFRGRVEVNDRFGLSYRATPASLWRRARPSSDLLASARLVRERVRSDAAVPAWARAQLPLIAVIQLATVFCLRPLYLAVRRLRGQ